MKLSLLQKSTKLTLIMLSSSLNGNRNSIKRVNLTELFRYIKKRQSVLKSPGSYENSKHRKIQSLRTASGHLNFDSQSSKNTGMLILFFRYYKGITFPDKQKPSILGFKGIQDGSGTHLGYKMLDSSESVVMPDGEAKVYVADYPFDMLAGKKLFSCIQI